jgi:hypothetical protein
MLNPLWYLFFNIYINFERGEIEMEHKDKKERVKKESYEKPDMKKEGNLKDITAAVTVTPTA